MAAVDQGRLAFADLHLVTPSRPSMEMGNLTAGQIGISGVHAEVKGQHHGVHCLLRDLTCLVGCMMTSTRLPVAAQTHELEA